MKETKIHYSLDKAPVFGMVDVVCTEVSKPVFQATKHKEKVTCKNCKRVMGKK